MKILAITQARLGSTRLPGKVLKKVGDQTLLQCHLSRIQKATRISQLVVATTVEQEDAAVEQEAKRCGLEVYRGSVNDVLDRFYQAAAPRTPDYVVRLTSDCPLIDPELIDKVVAFVISENLDYASNTLRLTYPDGLDVEVLRFSSLERAWKEATLLSEREHVTPYIYKNSTFHGKTLFKAGNYEEGDNLGDLRITVDEPADFEVLSFLLEKLGPARPWREYIHLLLEHPEICAINSKHQRNEGYIKSLKKDQKL
jgi:spore coat polysaccharide biosynthesis protein SpsF (cytidylyltransferase family)